MEKKTEWTMKCPKCKGKINVIVEPLQEITTCPVCGAKLKVVKKLQIMALQLDPDLPNKSIYSYELQIIDE